MTKKFFYSLFICGLITGQVNAQKMNIDTIAVAILDRMAAMIGDLSSCHVTVSSHYDVRSQHLGLVKHGDEEELYMQGPDKLLIRAEGDRGIAVLYITMAIRLSIIPWKPITMRHSIFRTDHGNDRHSK